MKDEPENALAWARLSELWLMQGRLGRAREAAKKPRELAPELARTQTVLGFAELAEINTGRAKKAFRRAIAIDSASPLPRFGLGLATIRAGDLEGGRQQIEIAVALDPKNALLRSYLGKAYFDERTTNPLTYFQELVDELPEPGKHARRRSSSRSPRSSTRTTRRPGSTTPSACRARTGRSRRSAISRSRSS